MKEMVGSQQQLRGGVPAARDMTDSCGISRLAVARVNCQLRVMLSLYMSLLISICQAKGGPQVTIVYSIHRQAREQHAAHEKQIAAAYRATA